MILISMNILSKEDIESPNLTQKKKSEYFWVERNNNRSVSDTVRLVEKHFGW